MRELRTQERRPVRSGACWAGWRPYTGYHPPPATLFQSKNERRPQQEGRRSANDMPGIGSPIVGVGHHLPPFEMKYPARRRVSPR
jgi:hypothetical protein